jgi:hypothetical protein
LGRIRYIYPKDIPTGPHPEEAIPLQMKHIIIFFDRPPFFIPNKKVFKAIFPAIVAMYRFIGAKPDTLVRTLVKPALDIFPKKSRRIPEVTAIGVYLVPVVPIQALSRAYPDQPFGVTKNVKIIVLGR